MRKHLPLQFQLYMLFIFGIVFSYISFINNIYYIGLFIIILLTINTIYELNKELLMITEVVNNIKKSKIKSKIRTNEFNFIDLRILVSHLNDIIDVHQKTITKANYYNSFKKEKDFLSKTINIDEMTGLLKRNKFVEECEKIIRTCSVVDDDNFFIAFLDIDHFKKVNDNYGHDIGDKVLIQFSNIIKQHSKNIRNSEQIFAARWGGEEFVVCYCGMSKNDLHKKLEKFRLDVESESFPEVNKITVSIGYSQIDFNNKNETLDLIIKRADEGVYLSKENGRNQINYVK